jgi:hypothetical protein
MQLLHKPFNKTLWGRSYPPSFLLHINKEKTMNNSIIQFKNGTESELSTENPILAKAEMALESDTNKIKFGDGETAYNDLPYIGGAGNFKYGLYGLSANQTSNLTTNSHVEFDTKIGGSLPAPTTGSGQAKGIITLPAGKTYKISFNPYTTHSSGGYVHMKVYDRTNSTFVGPYFSSISCNYNSYTAAPTFTCSCIITPDVDTDIDMRITGLGPLGLTAFLEEGTFLLIEEYGGY